MTRSASQQSSSTAAPLLPLVLGHSLFPVLAGLWCAALLGGCGVVASADALASLVLHLHLPAVLPAATPPLGFTARLLVSMGLALLGGVSGLVLGTVLRRRLAMPSVVAVRPRAAPEDDAPTVARAMADPVADEAPRVRSRDAHPDAPPRRPLVVTQDVLPYDSEPEPEFHRPAAYARAAANDAVSSQPPAWVMAELSQDHADEGPDLPFADTLGAHDDHLPPFLAAAIAATRAPEQAPEAEAPEPEAPEPEAPEPEAPRPPAVHVAPVPLLASKAAAAPQVPIGAAPLASLGLVQLIERLALAIAERHAHREAAAAPLGHARPDPAREAHFPETDPQAMDPVGPLLRAKPSRTGRDTPTDSHDTLTVGHLHDPLAEGWVEDADKARLSQDDTVDSRYSSLADMTLPRPALVQSHEPLPFVARLPGFGGETSDPVVPFPLRGVGVEPDEPRSEADRALREALATLRRMSGQR